MVELITNNRVLAVITARGGSTGLPGKNIRLFCGLPLIAHTILFSRLCPEISRCVVSTDSAEIAEISNKFEADIPFLRPAELAQNDTPIWPVLRHALERVEEEDGTHYDMLLLLDPTSPAREPSDIQGALTKLLASPSADGIIGVSEPDFNPIWHCVVEEDGWMVQLMEQGKTFERRQDVPKVYRVNGSLYIWRTEFVRTESESWHNTDNYIMYEVPEYRAMSFDTLPEFKLGELMVNSGLVSLPWLLGKDEDNETG